MKEHDNALQETPSGDESAARAVRNFHTAEPSPSFPLPQPYPMPLNEASKAKPGTRIAVMDGWLHFVEDIGGRATLMQCPPSMGYAKGCVTYDMNQASVCSAVYAKSLLAWLSQ